MTCGATPRAPVDNSAGPRASSGTTTEREQGRPRGHRSAIVGLVLAVVLVVSTVAQVPEELASTPTSRKRDEALAWLADGKADEGAVSLAWDELLRTRQRLSNVAAPSRSTSGVGARWPGGPDGPRHVGLADVRAALPQRAALVTFARFEPTKPPAGEALRGRSVPRGAAAHGSYLAFVLPQAPRAPCVVRLGEAEPIDRLAANWRDCLSDLSAALTTPRVSEQRCRDLGLALGRRVWEPLVEPTASAQRVFVVPDGPLGGVNLAALPLRQGGYLIESGPTLHVLTSEDELVLATESSRAVGREGLVAIGDPDVDAPLPLSDSVGRTATGPRASVRHDVPQRANAAGPHGLSVFMRLAHARAEIQDIAHAWRQQPQAGAAWLLDGAEATEAEVRRLAPQARVLHLATQVAGSTRRVSADAAVLSNPLLRAGVVLAGANHRAEAGPGQDDGILTAEEAASLDLDGTEWVVLSGCETGRGAWHASDGVLGLRRAFAVAGARTVIMSLWAVSDEYARRWMRALYEARFEQHLDTAEAVRAASLAILRARRQQGASTHPALWAAFVATGDWH